jgi:hypothetical protein
MKIGSPTAPRRRWAILILVPAAAAFVALVALIASSNRSTPGLPSPRILRAPTLGEGAWEVTSDGDFEEQTADIVDARLRLRLATRRTRADTSKFLGVRRQEEVRLSEGTSISVDLDWNSQANGSGLTAGLVLATASTTKNPLESPACLQIEYVGVPPGKNVRMVVAVREDGRHRHLFSEGWPDKNKEGRRIGLQRLQVLVGKDRSFKLLENGQELFASAPNALAFDKAWLYLQISSRSNYPPRDVFYANVAVEPGR